MVNGVISIPFVPVIVAHLGVVVPYQRVPIGYNYMNIMRNKASRARRNHLRY